MSHNHPNSRISTSMIGLSQHHNIVHSWGCKQDLYRVKFLVDELLEKCPTYSVEADWLREQEAEKIVRILKNEM